MILLSIKQPSSGYRFSIDSFLLADFIAPKNQNIILDLGTGCGIIPMLLAQTFPEIFIIGVEIQKELADIAKKNILENTLGKCITILHQDMKNLNLESIHIYNNTINLVDFVICNPPYTPEDTGRVSLNTQQAIARHEIFITLAELIEISKKKLKNSGKLALIYPAKRLTSLLTMMHNAQVEPKRLRIIQPYHTAPAKLIMIEGVKNARPGITLEAPLIIYKEKNNYTDEIKLIYKKFNYKIVTIHKQEM